MAYQMTSVRAELPQQPASVSQADGMTRLDATIFNRDDWDRMPAEESRALRVEAIGDALRHHAENCAPFGKYCARLGFDPAAPLSADQLTTVPQFPSSVFKTLELCSVPHAEIVHRFESSGTSGLRSRIPRDELTLARLSGSLRGTADIWSDVIGDVDMDDDVFVIHLGPSRRNAGSVWFGYVMSLIELEAETEHLLSNGKVDIGRTAKLVKTALTERRRVLVVGAPFLIEELCHWFEQFPLDAGNRLFLITGGGWKRHTGKVMSRTQLAELACRTLGLDSTAQVRDIFNQVELNSAFVQCGEGRLHVPPWVEVIVRDPATLRPLPSGCEGLLSYLDPTAHSYPAFFIGEDLGIRDDSPCGCGRTSATIQMVRRLRVTTHEGCALQTERAAAVVHQHVNESNHR